jgi:phosphonate transport system substrate-binding protein
VASAKLHNEYDPAAYVTLWKSQPIPQDPFAVRGDLPEAFKQKLANVLRNLDFHQLSDADQKFIAASVSPPLKTVPQTDNAYNQIRDLIKTLHVDLAKL